MSALIDAKRLVHTLKRKYEIASGSDKIWIAVALNRAESILAELEQKD